MPMHFAGGQNNFSFTLLGSWLRPHLPTPPPHSLPQRQTNHEPYPWRPRHMRVCVSGAAGLLSGDVVRASRPGPSAVGPPELGLWPPGSALERPEAGHPWGAGRGRGMQIAAGPWPLSVQVRRYHVKFKGRSSHMTFSPASWV